MVHILNHGKVMSGEMGGDLPGTEHQRTKMFLHYTDLYSDRREVNSDVHYGLCDCKHVQTAADVTAKDY